MFSVSACHRRPVRVYAKENRRGSGWSWHPNPLFGTDWDFIEVRVVAQTASPVNTLPGTMTSLSPYAEVDADETRTFEDPFMDIYNNYS